MGFSHVLKDIRYTSRKTSHFTFVPCDYWYYTDIEVHPVPLVPLRRKSRDWFLYDNGLRHERVNSFSMLQKQMSSFSITWITSSAHMSWKYWIMMDYGKTKQFLDENQRLVWIKLIQWYRLVNIGWLADIDFFGSMIWLTCLTIIRKNENTVGGSG